MAKTPIDLRKLPPLKALKGFEAATRRQSVREAADELCLTHPAISHQIQLLESDLGVQLFSRDGRTVVPTAAGRFFYTYVRDALDRLIEGAEAVRRSAANQPLRVQTYVTASIRWLAQRLPDFCARHPEVNLLLTTCAVDWEFDELNADVGLVYCESVPDPHFHWIPLFEYRLVPLCSPALLGGRGRFVPPEAFAQLPRVSIYTEARNWDTWFESAGMPEPSAPLLVVDTLAIALEMAIAGQAVALMNGPFADQDLAGRRLVQAFDHTVVCPGEWGLICRSDRRDDPRVRLFMDWLANTVAQPRGTVPGSA